MFEVKHYIIISRTDIWYSTVGKLDLARTFAFIHQIFITLMYDYVLFMDCGKMLHLKKQSSMI